MEKQTLKLEPQLALLRESLVSSIETLAGIIAHNDSGSRLFPNGVTKVAIQAKLGDADMSVEIEGPDKGGSAETLLDMLTKKVSISFGPNGEGSLSYGGKSVPCLGSTSVKYTKDLTVRGELDVDKFRRKYSNEYSVWMEFATLIMGARGIYIHEGADTLATNGGESMGCIHLGPGNAEAFWNWVDGPTRITIEYPW